MREPAPTQAARKRPPTRLPYCRRGTAPFPFVSESESEPESPSPRPSYIWPALEVAAAPVSVAVPLADDVVSLTLVGFWAPHGWFSRQSLAQAASLPQLVTHWLPHSWQIKNGRVSEYSERFGDFPSSHTQPYVKAI